MVYKWKTGHIKINPQIAGEVLEAIKDNFGEITRENVVESSRSINSPLHSCFEWDDSIAAEKYSLEQAGHIIRSITIEIVTPDECIETVAHAEIIDNDEDKTKVIQTRAIVSVDGKYVPIHDVMNNDELSDKLLQQALNDLIVYKKKYAVLKELSELFKTVDVIVEKYTKWVIPV